MKKKVVVLLSGGMDSSTLLYHHIARGDEVRAIGVHYGQRHHKELLYARKIAALAPVPFTAVDLSPLREVLPGSSQTDDEVEVPEGHYTEEAMKLTVVPNRNMILLAIAIGHAVAHKVDQVSYAAHSGDHAIYPDCRPEFAAIIAQAALKCDWHPVELVSPFIELTKAQIVSVGDKLGVPFTDTWSCYKGTSKHCGVCGTCIERREAFHLAGVEDPTSYDPFAPTAQQLASNGWKL